MVKSNQNIHSDTPDSTSNEYVFRPRARIMRILGQELISSEAIAILELVKNAYDADATKVLIRFTGVLEKGKGTIEIIDNGHGMSMETIKSAWMEPATNSKRSRRTSEELNRKLLGEKGVGRFACSRLASELELITRRKTDTKEVLAVFDWTQFDNEKLYLDQIEVLAEPREPKEIFPGGTIALVWADNIYDKPSVTDLKHGTILRMNRLNKGWSSIEFADLQRDLSRLVSPFEQFSDFSIRLELPEEFSQYSKEISSPGIIRYPHYVVKGSVQEDGEYSFKVQVKVSGLTKELKGHLLWGTNKKDEPILMMLAKKQANELIDSIPDDELAERKIQTGPFSIELRVWDRDDLGNVKQKTSSTLEDVRRDLDAVAGINIYRDGFRVLPYGEPKDDWLRLDLRRVQKPTWRLSNNQIVGFVSISSEKNPQLKDQSNREGLDENQALKDLRAVLLLLLTEVENIRYPLRNRRSKQPFSKPVHGLFNALNLDNLRTQVSTKYPGDKETQKFLDETQKALNSQVDEIQTVIARYQRLATLGTLIDAILHDGRHPLGSIIKQAILGQEDVDDAKSNGSTFKQNLRKRFEKIEEQGNFLNSTFDRIEPFGGRRRGRPTQLYLEEIIKSAISVFQTDIKKLGVKISLPKSETLARVDQAEIQQIVLNLLQNSLYWLEYVEKEKRKIIITVERISEDYTEILFADSGPGVEPEYKELIFEPYFSTKPNGVGLGLAIAGEIVSDFYNGKLELIDSDLLAGAVFRVTLKKRV
jgi:signal transduction histidine kinase